jgi:hypothetical protein
VMARATWPKAASNEQEVAYVTRPELPSSGRGPLETQLSAQRKGQR